MMTPGLPLRLIFPSLSTITPGDFSNTSSAVRPLLVAEASTFTTVLSIWFSMSGRFPTTVTLSRETSEGFRRMVLTDRDGFEVVSSRGWLYQLEYPMCETARIYLPGFIFSNVNWPALSVIATFTVVESLIFRRETDTASIFLPPVSSTLPLIWPAGPWPSIDRATICKTTKIDSVLIHRSVWLD